MYITNRPEVAEIAEQAGVDWIFVDMEFIGKDARQGGLDTVQNHHTVEDVRRIKQAVTNAKVLVRVNPIHDALDNYPSSKDEIDALGGAILIEGSPLSSSIFLAASWTSLHMGTINRFCGLYKGSIIFSFDIRNGAQSC